MRLNASISPHDLRRHSATYASRNGVPFEIILKVLLRHQDLKTTQVYLRKISDTEAITWMDILHGNRKVKCMLIVKVCRVLLP